METQAKHRPTEKADESIQYLGRIAERGRQAGRQFTGTRERNDKPQALSQRQAGTQGDRPQGQPASGCKRNEMKLLVNRGGRQARPRKLPPHDALPTAA